MSGLEKAVERLKLEGYTTEEIQNALQKMVQEALSSPILTDQSLGEYLDSLEDEED